LGSYVKEKKKIKSIESNKKFIAEINIHLEEMHEKMYEESKKKTEESMVEGNDWKEFLEIIENKKIAKMHHCNERECEVKVGERSSKEGNENRERIGEEDELMGKAKSLCIPSQEGFDENKKCFCCGKESNKIILHLRYGEAKPHCVFPTIVL